MATIINNPPGSNQPPRDEGSGVGLVVGILAIVLLVILFFVYVRPMITRTPGVPNTGGTSASGTSPSSNSVNVQVPNYFAPSNNPSGTPASP